MVMEKPSPLLVGREFVRQYYTLLNKAPDFLHRFYGRNSSYVHGGLDPSGKPQEAVYGQAGSVPNKFYVHNDIFRYEDEVFGDSEAEMDEESEEEVEEEQEERQPSPEPVQENSNNAYYDSHPVSNGVEESLEEPINEPEPEPEPELKSEEMKPEPEEKNIEELEEKSPTPPPVEPIVLPQEPPKAFSWASVTSKNLPPSGTVPSSGIPPHVIKAPASQTRPESKQETQVPPPRTREQRPRERPTFQPRGPRTGRGETEQGESDNRRMFRYPDSHQLFVGNLPHDIDESELKEFFMSYGNVMELRINTKGVGGKLPNFGFVVFDDSEPVQRILLAKPIMFRGEVRLNVEEKKTRAARERETRGGDDRRDIRRNDRGGGGPRGIIGGGMMRDRDGRGPPPRGGMAQKLSTGRGAASMEGRFTSQRR
ncbi:ras GTPase-activating protein-binding protein 2 isoform X3 [Pseudophryne corroboree]|uniref:ras GTPase-activating protein-binding protein 2 isoform X3 n=1 Tax=Pseudophryne corroboree TaxID=495146 RepID=UPI003081EE17